MLCAKDKDRFCWVAGIVSSGKQIDCSHRKGSDNYMLKPNTTGWEAKNMGNGSVPSFRTILHIGGVSDCVFLFPLKFIFLC